MFVSIFVTTTCLVTVFFAYYKWSYQYWKRLNTPYIKPKIPFGMRSELIRGVESLAVTMARYYEEMKQLGWKHGGLYFFTTPLYLPLKLSYLEHIFIKDFQCFTDRVAYFNETKDILKEHLINVDGPKWRVLRPKLTSPFSVRGLKSMVRTMVNCHTNLLKQIDEACVNNEPIDVKDVSLVFAADVIESCIFGADPTDSKNESYMLKMYGRETSNLSKLQYLLRILATGFPKVATLLGLRVFSQEVIDFYMNLVQGTVDYREEKQYVGNDLLQILIDLKKTTSGSNTPYTMKDLVAQTYGFFASGFDPSSTLMCYGLYELAKNPTIQERVRKEILAVLEQHDGDISYDSLKEMKYLNQVIKETLRMYPPIPLLSRRCVKDWKVPDEDVIIEKGTMVMISVLALHYDEDYYPNPKQFDPDRFGEENRRSIPQCAYLPFGEGYRSCIGKELGIIQAKIGFCRLLKNFQFRPKNQSEDPSTMRSHTFSLKPTKKIYLNAVKI